MRKRCQERLGFTPTTKEIKSWCGKILDGTAKFIKNAGGGRAIYDLDDGDYTFRFVFDFHRKGIATVLHRYDFIDNKKLEK